MITEAPPTKPRINTAAEVRAIVKPLARELDIPKFSVRFQNNPFGGDGLFFVSVPAPEGVSVMTSSASDRIGTTFGSSDGGTFAGKLQQLSRSLREMTLNVRVS